MGQPYVFGSGVQTLPATPRQVFGSTPIVGWTSQHKRFSDGSLVIQVREVNARISRLPAAVVLVLDNPTVSARELARQLGLKSSESGWRWKQQALLWCQCYPEHRTALQAMLDASRQDLTTPIQSSEPVPEAPSPSRSLARRLLSLVASLA